MSKAIKILFLAPDPTNVVYRPRLGEEFREIERELRGGSHRESFELVSALAVRPDDLQAAFFKHKPDIVHLSGHGSRDALLLEDNDGKIKPVPKAALADLFRLFNHQIRVVVLNSCHSKIQLEALKETIDYTVAMNNAVQDETAIAFASAFYRALAFGQSVTQSFYLALNQLGLSGIAGADVPQLLVKDGVDISKPFVDPPDSQSERPLQPSGPQAKSGRSDSKSIEVGAAAWSGDSKETKYQSGKTNGKRALPVTLSAITFVSILAIIGWRFWAASNRPIRTLSYWALLQKYHDGIPVGNPVSLSNVSGEAYFAFGDAITFFFTSPRKGHLYVINEETSPQTSSSTLRIVFPSPESDPPSSEIRAGEQVFTSELLFDGNKGTERLWIICTDEPCPQVEVAIQMSANGRNQGVITEAGTVGFVRDLLSQSVPLTRVSGDTINSRMIVEANGNILVYLVKLIHR